MHRRASPTGAGTALVLVGLFGVVLLLMVAGASQARAGTVTKVTLTTAPGPGGPGTSTPTTTPPTVAPTTLRATSTTRTTATTRPAAATAPVTAAPVKNAPATVPVPVTRVAPTTVPAPTTTILGIRSQLPAGPATLPLRTTGSNGHVDPTFAWLSGAGFAVALAMVAGRLLVTRPGGRDRAPLS